MKLAALLVELFLLARDPYLYQTVFHYVNNITFHHRYRFISFFGSYSDLTFYIVVYSCIITILVRSVDQSLILCYSTLVYKNSKNVN